MSDETYHITVTVNDEAIEMRLSEGQVYREFPSIAEQIKAAAEGGMALEGPIISNRTVAEMTPLERQVFRTTTVWAQLCCDARNDKPWSELRHGKILDEELSKLASFCGYALDDEEFDKLWADDAEPVDSNAEQS